MARLSSRGIVARIFRTLGLVLLGVVVAAIAGVVLYLDSRPALSVWHTVHLEEEFQAGSGVDSFADYLALEQRLFEELDTKVYGEVSSERAASFGRYTKGSPTDPTSAAQNWNRSFELIAEAPTVGVLLLHGLSDSPYSMRALGTEFHAAGAHVVGLRVPGHGTAPSGLTTTTFADMAAAVELAMLHLRETVGEGKIYVVGYSNGGALAVNYATHAVQQPALPDPAGLILMSPEIGVSPVAQIAGPLTWFGQTFGMHKLAWASVDLEYDPYKYNSFALRADLTAWNATQAVKTQLQALEDSGDIARLPPILAFQSAADATVQAPALISELFDSLQGDGHHLVLFDANQVYGARGLLSGVLDVNTVLEGDPRGYTVSVITNAASDSFSTVMQQRAAGTDQTDRISLTVDWPTDVYSLAHVALPFAPDDPVYGSRDVDASAPDMIRFGDLPIYGERNAFKIPATGLIRQHWNPFYSVMTEISLRFLQL